MPTKAASNRTCLVSPDEGHTRSPSPSTENTQRWPPLLTTPLKSAKCFICQNKTKQSLLCAKLYSSLLLGLPSLLENRGQHKGRNSNNKARSFLDLIIHTVERVRWLSPQAFCQVLALPLPSLVSWFPVCRHCRGGSRIKPGQEEWPFSLLREAAGGASVALGCSTGELPREKREHRAGWLSRTLADVLGFILWV